MIKLASGFGLIKKPKLKIQFETKICSQIFVIEMSEKHFYFKKINILMNISRINIVIDGFIYIYIIFINK